MGKRKVRCQKTLEYGLSGEFYRVPYKGRNLYYKNEEVYLEEVEERKLKHRINHFVAFDILDYDGNQYLPPLFMKRINELHENYPLEVILSTFEENKDTLKYWMSQDSKFKNEAGRINYMMAIIRGNINDEYTKWKTKERRGKLDNTVKVDVGLLDVELENKKSDGGISEFL